MVTLHLIISGEVQGVFYRASAGKKAAEFNVHGWIKNTSDGNVEAMISGEEPDVDRFVEWCKIGPDRAIVTEVRLQRKEYRKFDSFRVKK